MTQRAIIENYAQAITIVKEMNLGYTEWEDGDWKDEGRKAIKRIIEDRMSTYRDMHLTEIRDEGVEVICVDGGKGLLSALMTVYPDIPIQRCWAHKMRNILNKVKKKDLKEVQRDLQKIYRAKGEKSARSGARRFADRWDKSYPHAVKCLKKDLDELLTFFKFKEESVRKIVKTTNAIERRFREVRRRTRPMGVFSSRTSMERILFAVSSYENKKEGTNTPFLLTQNN
jgi:transposase-like protein